MSDRPATEAIIEHSRSEAMSLAMEYGWDSIHPTGVLKAYLTDMEQRGETPTEYARRQGWIE